MSEELETLKKIEFKINELLKWTRFAGMQQLKNILAQEIGDDEVAACAYEFSNGTRGTREVAKLAGIRSHNTVALYWRKWSKMGIVEPSTAYQGRCQRICSLEEVGLSVPKLPQPPNSKHQAQSEAENNE
ncbi:MAG: hypothetical protein NWF04_00095 [Candidatus Bathyarchaeota archaeon]|nr:hypothetical protein [Candidatus Bathyarchaeota archaeon]